MSEEESREAEVEKASERMINDWNTNLMIIIMTDGELLSGGPVNIYITNNIK